MNQSPPLAVSVAYDEIAQLYTDLFMNQLDVMHDDRAQLHAFANWVGTGGRVLDAGCGPGYVAAHLQELGITTCGIDASPALIEIAKEHFPDGDYAVADMAQLTHDDESFDGVVSRFSSIHVPPVELDQYFREFARVLKPGGLLQIGFFSTNDPAEHGNDFDHQAYTAYQFDPDALSRQLAANGLIERTRYIRQPQPGERRQFPSGTLTVAKAAKAT